MMARNWGTLQDIIQPYRGRIAILFVLVAVVYFMLAFADQAWRARQLEIEAGQQRAAIAAIERENVELRRQLAVYESDSYLDYVQSRARRDLNLANPGETVLLVRWSEPQASPTATTATPAVEEHVPNWRAWLDALALD